MIRQRQIMTIIKYQHPSTTTESDSTSNNLSNKSDNTTVNNEDTTLQIIIPQTSPMHNTKSTCIQFSFK